MVDQSNSVGTFGGRIYIWDGSDLEGGVASEAEPADVIDLGMETAGMCLALPGANPVRPHMIFFNAAHSHAVLAFVASGHVVVFDAMTRRLWPLFGLPLDSAARDKRTPRCHLPTIPGYWSATRTANNWTGSIATTAQTNLFIEPIRPWTWPHSKGSIYPTTRRSVLQSIRRGDMVSSCCEEGAWRWSMCGPRR